MFRVDHRDDHRALTFGHVVKKGPMPGGTGPLKPCLTRKWIEARCCPGQTRGYASDSRWSRDTASLDPLTTLLQPMAVVIGLCGLSPPGSQPTERTFDVIGRVEPLHLDLVHPWPIDRRLHEGAGRELAAHRRDLILGIRNLPLAVIPLHG